MKDDRPSSNPAGSSQPPLGLIAGDGRLPVLVAQGAVRAGRDVVCVSIADQPAAELAALAQRLYRVSVARPTGWLRRLRRHRVTEAIMVGRVPKARLYTPWRLIKYLPDWRAFRIYYWRLRHRTRRTDDLLGALADELAHGGVVLQDSTQYCREYLADPGILTKHRPARRCEPDIEFGWRIAKTLGDLDIGQAVAVREREVIAVEAIEGTAAMIERAGSYCRKGGWLLIKTAKPNQDMRFDVPCVGPDTIRSLAEHGASVLVIEAGKTLIIDKAETLALADRLGIAVVGRT